MKHLLNGVAIAAALAIAAPVWAQAPSSPSAPKAPAAPAAAAAPAPAAPAAAASAGAPAYKQRHKRVHQRYAGRRSYKGGGDMMTDQLNRDELARIQGGGMPMAAPPGGGAGQGGPRPSGR